VQTLRPPCLYLRIGLCQRTRSTKAGPGVVVVPDPVSETEDGLKGAIGVERDEDSRAETGAEWSYKHIASSWVQPSLRLARYT
jgi:hypothetical protein